jgi:uncharacterized membrane protein
LALKKCFIVKYFPAAGKDSLGMKLAGFLLLVSGFGIVLAAILLLPSASSRIAFVFMGIGVEAIGLVLVARSHLLEVGERP